MQIVDENFRRAAREKERQSQQQVDKQRIGDNGKGSPKGKVTSAEETPAQQKERDISNEYHQTNWPTCEVIDQLRDSTYPTRSQIRRDEENPQADRLNQRAKHNENEIPNGCPILFHGAILLRFFILHLSYFILFPILSFGTITLYENKKLAILAWGID